MPVAATGVQACEWRLVGVARQFEVLCWITTGRDARGYRFVVRWFLKSGWLLDLIFQSVICLRSFCFDLISTIDHHPDLFKPRTCGRRFWESCSVGTGNLFVCNCRPLCIVSSTYVESRPDLFWQWRDRGLLIDIFTKLVRQTCSRAARKMTG
jgi:hypothetical protein